MLPVLSRRQRASMEIARIRLALRCLDLSPDSPAWDSVRAVLGPGGTAAEVLASSEEIEERDLSALIWIRQRTEWACSAFRRGSRAR